MPYKKAHSRLFVAVVGSLCVLFISLAIAYSLVMRLYLRAYYCSAHAAALSIIPGLLLLSQLVFTCRLPVGCTPRSYWILLSVLNVLHFLAFATLAVCYSLVTRTPSFHLNYDYIAAFSWYYADVIITLSLIIVTSVEAARHHRGSFTLNQRNASGSGEWCKSVECYIRAMQCIHYFITNNISNVPICSVIMGCVYIYVCLFV